MCLTAYMIMIMHVGEPVASSVVGTRKGYARAGRGRGRVHASKMIGFSVPRRSAMLFWFGGIINECI